MRAQYPTFVSLLSCANSKKKSFFSVVTAWERTSDTVRVHYPHHTLLVALPLASLRSFCRLDSATRSLQRLPHAHRLLASTAAVLVRPCRSYPCSADLRKKGRCCSSHDNERRRLCTVDLSLVCRSCACSARFIGASQGRCKLLEEKKSVARPSTWIRTSHTRRSSNVLCELRVAVVRCRIRVGRENGMQSEDS